MNTQQQRLPLRVITWLMSEILLNAIGLDNLADYSEFIFERHFAVHSGAAVETIVRFTNS